MRITYFLTGFLLIYQAEEPSGRDSQLDSNRDVALKHNEQHQTQADHIVQLPDQVDHINIKRTKQNLPQHQRPLSEQIQMAGASWREYSECVQSLQLHSSALCGTK